MLFLAPVLGGWLSTATSPLEMLLWPPAFVLMVSLYGCGALLCREIARHHGLGLGGLCLLAIGSGLFGRYDLTLGALAVVWLLWRLRVRVRTVAPVS